MFSSMKEFNSATKVLFRDMRSNKKMTITQFREQLATQFTIYSSLAAFQASFDIDKLQSDFTEKAKGIAQRNNATSTKALIDSFNRKGTLDADAYKLPDMEKLKSQIWDKRLEDIAKPIKEATDFIEEHGHALIDGNMRLMTEFEQLIKSYYDNNTEDNLEAILGLFDSHLQINPNGNEEKLNQLRAILNRQSLAIDPQYNFITLDNIDTKEITSGFGTRERLTEHSQLSVYLQSILMNDGALGDIDSNTVQAALLHDAMEDGDIDDRLSLSELYDLFMTSNIEVFNNGKNAHITKEKDHFSIEYNSNGCNIHDAIYFSKLESYSTNGTSFYFESENEINLEIRFNRNFLAESLNLFHSFMRIGVKCNNEMIEDSVFLHDSNIDSYAKEKVINLLEQYSSNADEHNSNDINEIIQDGSYRIGDKEIIIDEI